MKKIIVLLLIMLPLLSGFFLLKENALSNDEKITRTSYNYSPHALWKLDENINSTGLFPAYEDKNMTTKFQWPYGASFAVFSEGDYLFAGFGAAINIYQLSSKGEATFISEIKTQSRVLKMVKNGKYLFIANQKAGVAIYDISNLSFPVFVKKIATTYDAMDITVRGNYIYVADGWYGGYEGGYNYTFKGQFKIIDIADVQNPIVKTDIDMGGECTAVYVKGAYAYVISIRYSMWDGTHTGLYIYDISNPASPALQSSLDLGSPHNYTDDMGDVTVVNNFAFVTSGVNGIKQVDISNIQSPILINTIPINSEYAFRIEQYQTNLLLMNRYKGIVTINVTDASKPGTPIYKSFAGQQMDAFYNNGFIFLASEREGIHILKASDFSIIQQIKKAHEVRNIYLDDNLLIIADGDNGIKFFQRNSQSVELIGNWTNGKPVSAIAKKGNYLYVTQGTTTTKILDVTDPRVPVLIKSILTSPNFCNDIYIKNDRLFITQIDDGITVFDLADPANPQKLGSFNTKGRTWNCKLAGDYIYTSSDSAGIRVLNISNPQSIYENGFYDPSGQVYDIDINENKIFVAAGKQGLLILDKTDPAGPYLLKEYKMLDGKDAIGVMFQSPLVYVTTSYGGLYAYYVYPDGSVAELGHHIPEGLHSEIFWGGDLTQPVVDSNNKIYLGCGVLGFDQIVTEYTTSVERIANQIPTEFQLMQNFPNPFNPTTTIRFFIPKNEMVQITVYDLTGRKVETILNQFLSIGPHEVKWKASNFSSGIYFYKLETKDFSDIKKMILLR